MPREGVSLTRPPRSYWRWNVDLVRRNTFTTALVQDLIKAYDLFDRDDRVRVVVLTAEPTAPAFCAGVGSIPVHYAMKHDSRIYIHELGRPQRRLDGHVPPRGSEGGRTWCVVYGETIHRS